MALLLSGCVAEQSAPSVLVLDGPARVRVDQLGPVVGPRVRLEDGSEPQVVLAVSPPAVARVQGSTIVAEAPGEAVVTASFEGRKITWTLVVDPSMVLRILDAPPTLAIGDTGMLRAVASMGDTDVDAGEIGWSSSDPELLAVAADGSMTALGSGRVWVTARTRAGAQSMVEIDIR